jgi:N-methylhydantoinase B
LGRTPPVAMADEAVFYELEIVRGRLQAIVDEAGAAIRRTAFSNVIREAHDFACAILTPDGHTVVQSQQSIPGFIGTMGWTWRGMQRLYPGFDQLQPGDVLATNDPWLATGQLNDVTLMAPVFANDVLIGYAGVVAHQTDIGGRGLIVGGASQVFEEGLRLPVVKLATAHGMDPTVADIIAWNVRLPDQVLGDLNSEINAATVISTRLVSLATELGLERLLRMSRELEERAEAYMRSVISALPDGTYRSSLASEGGPNAPFSLQLNLHVKGDEMVVDIDGSDEVAEGINSTYSYSYAYSIYGCKCLLAPELPYNDGLFRPITLTAREGSVANCRFPSPTSGRTVITHRLTMLVINALEDAMPEAIIAESGNPQALFSVRGTWPGSGRLFATTVSSHGGYGARAHKDGISAWSFPTNVTGVSAEMMEINNPLFYLERELIPDSGGPGTFRGGLGQREVVRILADNAYAFARAQWIKSGPRGVRGGNAGERTSVKVNGTKVPRLTAPITLKRGDVITVESAGGGGYGPARKRDRAAVESDVRLGYATAERVKSAYGWAPAGSRHAAH